MLKKIFSILGESNDKAVTRLMPQVDRVNAVEDGLKSKNMEELVRLSGDLKERALQGVPLESL